MIRGYFRTGGNWRRPFVLARISIPSLGIVQEVEFLVDTGADGTFVAPTDANRMRIDPSRLPTGQSSAGVGGVTSTVQVPATLYLDNRQLTMNLRILIPQTAAQRFALARVPSLLGRDVLAHFALVIEQRTDRVLLLEPAEADALSFP
jgi:predicted aspartyl protease